MEIIPAIDLLNNKCVRLTKGKFDDVTVYGDPVRFAKELEDKGVGMIHLCDLNRAQNNSTINSPIIREIIQNAKIDIQLVGGIKNVNTIEECLKLGAKRVVMSAGTILAMSDSDRSDLVGEYCQKIFVSIDGLDNVLVKNAWQDKTNIDLIESVKNLRDFGFNNLIYTDVSKDGTLTGPNYPMVQKIMEVFQKPILVAGGISLVSQLSRLKGMGARGAIFGKAVFSKNFNLNEALRLC